MAQSWSRIRKRLEQEFLCDSLKGRIQYFITHYHGAPDNYGRIALRVDGKEVLQGNPYTYYRDYNRLESDLKKVLEVPSREWNGKDWDNRVDNEAVENVVKRIANNRGDFEIYDITDAIAKYLESPIEKSLISENPIIRMLAVMDRRIGKRTVNKLKSELDKQPEWLKLFYRLRIEAEESN
jgi:hypothetical protein